MKAKFIKESLDFEKVGDPRKSLMGEVVFG